MTRQEIFNKAVAGLASQGFERSVNGAGYCLYRGPNNKKCALGHIIPDELYSVEMENGVPYRDQKISPYGTELALNPFHAAVGKRLDSLGLPPEDDPFLRSLQRAHDTADNPEDMMDRLRRFAHYHDLTLPPELQD